MHGCMVDLKKYRAKKLHRINQDSNFLGGNFSNRDNVRDQIQFRRESQPQHFKRRFFLKNTLIHFHISNTSVSLLHLMHAIPRAHGNTRATSSMRVKNAPLLFMTLVWDIRTKKMKERTKRSNLIVDHFSSAFVNLSLAWMFYFHVWLQNKGKFLVWSEYYNRFGIYQPYRVSLLEPRQNNLKITSTKQR